MLDGVLQSSLFHEAAYHEALVHPALFSHSNPKRVAIIGGGEGATLREALKHNTVEEVVMIDIDEKMVNVSRQHLPEWSDCSDMVGSASWCGDDPRAKIYYEDALTWFKTRYSDGGKSDALMDVIIMDAL
jgi:spermidine synthase